MDLSQLLPLLMGMNGGDNDGMQQAMQLLSAMQSNDDDNRMNILMPLLMNAFSQGNGNNQNSDSEQRQKNNSNGFSPINGFTPDERINYTLYKLLKENGNIK